jgi:hypothetical protein
MNLGCFIVRGFVQLHPDTDQIDAVLLTKISGFAV